VLPPGRRRPIAETLARLAGPDTADAAMTAAEMAELERAGHELGWHTVHHEPLPTLDDDELAAALEDGRRRLPGARTFAYPYGKVDARVVEATRAAGFETAFTTHAAGVTPDDDPLLLGRLLPSWDSPGHFALQLARRLVRRPGG
jgi:peptidoglycan/xylan/chitin deacetylase (PgdA/CDA1 family)